MAYQIFLFKHMCSISYEAQINFHLIRETRIKIIEVLTTGSVCTILVGNWYLFFFPYCPYSPWSILQTVHFLDIKIEIRFSFHERSYGEAIRQYRIPYLKAQYNSWGDNIESELKISTLFKMYVNTSIFLGNSLLHLSITSHAWVLD